MRVIVEADGGSRGNPGPAGYGAVVLDATTGEILAERAESIGTATNNVAEYGGLIAGLEAAVALGATEVDARMDSKLVVEQMSGRWQIKNEGLRPLAAKAADLVRRFDVVRFSWIPRAQNKRADALANRAMDAAAGKPVRSARDVADDAEPAPLPRPEIAGPDSPGRRLARDIAAGASPARGAAAPPVGSGGTVGAAVPAGGWEPRLAAPLRLILIRHGETSLTAQRRYSGRVDVALTERGLAQARAVADSLTGVAIDAVVSSPLERCLRTAEFLKAPIVTDPDLIECDFGDWDGLTFAEVRERWPDRVNAWLASGDVAPPGGESFETVATRVQAAVSRIRTRFPQGNIAVVSHVSPIKLILRDALAAGEAFLHRAHLDPAGISTVDLYPDGGISVRGVNETAHLRFLADR
ncbi:bifunctional RNase H/acid phosphatase [Virgisporangium aliadipatigenens]|uniref:Bifunctional RNase H/acid phosphatase n=1 Tax=Virgisporangium aliadipatigenens TaxID=741659 RepID=A0A8J3YMH3_9ACTN|nr:bifunctional RNase H/acid phosphatase [Virgisporangium aliadipatigenens]GIJ47002.1 bifunctional RNase H/acid phosphatase [Virgisporangium aliadipatigenens]